jgi:peptide/nickel transport system substrate-binding protein
VELDAGVEVMTPVLGRGLYMAWIGDRPRSATGREEGAAVAMRPARRRPRSSRPARLLSVVFASALLMQACTSAATPEDEGGETGGGTGDVKNPGVLIHAQGGEPETLDPARAEPGGRGGQAIIQVYEALVARPVEGPDFVPSLATEVPTQENGLVSEDGLTYTFPIREGVVFHDGTDLTADDVKYSWDRVIEMDLAEGGATLLTDIVRDTEVVDDFTFEVTLKEPAGWFLAGVVYTPTAVVVSQDAVESNGGVTAGEPNEFMDTSMVGTGPFRFLSWDRGSSLSFEAFDGYWGDTPPFDARWEVVPDNSVGLLGMEAGDYDIIEPTPQFASQLEGNEDICIEEAGFLLEPLHLSFNLNIPEDKLPPEDTIPADFFHDVRVRQAFNYAFDYEAYVAAGLEGNGAPGTYLPPDMFGSDPDAPKYSQDLAEAERLFRESGWWDQGFTVSVLVESNNPTFEAVGLILKDSLERLNDTFRVNILIVPEARFDEAHGSVPFEYAMWIKNADLFADPHQMMMTYFHPDGEWGETLGFANGYEDPQRIADLIERAGTSTDVAEREAIYSELLTLLHDDPMWLWAADEKNLQIHQCWVDFAYNPLWITPLWGHMGKG